MGLSVTHRHTFVISFPQWHTRLQPPLHSYQEGSDAITSSCWSVGFVCPAGLYICSVYVQYVWSCGSMGVPKCNIWNKSSLLYSDVYEVQSIMCDDLPPTGWLSLCSSLLSLSPELFISSFFSAPSLYVISADYLLSSHSSFPFNHPYQKCLPTGPSHNLPCKLKLSLCNLLSESYHTSFPADLQHYPVAPYLKSN